MLIRFLANTYIRLSPFEIGEKYLGHVNEGSIIEVEDEVIEGVLHEGVSKWYKDTRGWYYWGGEIEEIPEGEQVPIQEDFVLLEEEPPIASDDVDIEPEPPAVIPTEFDQQEEEPEVVVDDTLSEPLLPVAEEEQLVDHPQIPDYILGEEFAALSEEEPAVEDEEEPLSEPPAAPEENETNANLNWSIRDLEIDQLFWKEEVKGKGIRIAIFDTGINANHPLFNHLNLQEKEGDELKRMRNFIKDKEHDDLEDNSGSGTCSAGIIAALGDDDEQIGIAPEVELFIGKIRSSTSENISLESLEQAVKWAVKKRVNILLIGAALEKSGFSKEQQEQLIDLGEEIREKGIILIAPVGDTDSTVPTGYYPAALETALSIGAFDQAGERYSKTVNSFSLDVLAPGVGLRTTNLSDGIAEDYEGTAAAAAYTTGLMALLLGYLRKHSIPCCNPEKMIMLLKESSEIPGESWSKVRSYINGYGNINPTKFIQLSGEKTAVCL